MKYNKWEAGHFCYTHYSMTESIKEINGHLRFAKYPPIDQLPEISSNPIKGVNECIESMKQAQVYVDSLPISLGSKTLQMLLECFVSRANLFCQEYEAAPDIIECEWTCEHCM